MRQGNKIAFQLFYWYNVHESNEQCVSSLLRSCVMLACKQLFSRLLT